MNLMQQKQTLHQGFGVKCFLGFRVWGFGVMGQVIGDDRLSVWRHFSTRLLLEEGHHVSAGAPCLRVFPAACDEALGDAQGFRPVGVCGFVVQVTTWRSRV